MASRDTRARLAAAGDFYLCPLPQVQLTEDEFEAACKAVWTGQQALRSVVREGPRGQLELIAKGYEYPVTMTQQVDGKVESWTERRMVVRSVWHAQAAEAALRARVAKALTQIEALNQRGRGRKRFETVAAFRQAVVAIVQRYGVGHRVWFRLTPPATVRSMQGYRGQPARVEYDRDTTKMGEP
jgi:hypothetical protein